MQYKYVNLQWPWLIFSVELLKCYKILIYFTSTFRDEYQHGLWYTMYITLVIELSILVFIMSFLQEPLLADLPTLQFWSMNVMKYDHMQCTIVNVQHLNVAEYIFFLQSIVVSMYRSLIIIIVMTQIILANVLKEGFSTRSKQMSIPVTCDGRR